MIVHPVGHEAITIDERKQVLRRTFVAAADEAQRYQHYQHQKFQPAVHRDLQPCTYTIDSNPSAQFFIVDLNATQ
jgi:hypothetical protein